MTQEIKKGDEKPVGENIYIKDFISFLVQLKIRSQVLKVLERNFKITPTILIEPKDNDQNPKTPA